MVSLTHLRLNPNLYKLACKNKNRDVDIDAILVLDEKISSIQREIQLLREKRNQLATLGKNIQESERSEAKELKVKLGLQENELTTLKIKFETIVSRIPNLPLPEVPIGKDEEQNVEIKTIGSIRKFVFDPLDHISLGRRLDIIDMERGSKVSGYRGYFLKNEGAILHMALLLYIFQKLTSKGYTPIVAPSIVKSFTLFGTGQFPWGEQEVYKTSDEDSYLAGTAEVPVTSYYAGEILTSAELPKKFVAFSPCFRKEAGSHGKDTKGLYRVHEFFKIEQVIRRIAAKLRGNIR
jgi:seryl-tRNA synthetase